MANVQVGYGHSDVVGSAFDYYSGAIDVATGSTFNMQTGILLLNPAGAVAVTVNLPLNPPDGAYAFIGNASASIITLTAVNANTGDLLVSGVTPTALAAQTAAGSATPGIGYRYSLNGDIPKGLNPRSWIRVQ
jgi:hypothetical protein